MKKKTFTIQLGNGDGTYKAWEWEYSKSFELLGEVWVIHRPVAIMEAGVPIPNLKRWKVSHKETGAGVATDRFIVGAVEAARTIIESKAAVLLDAIATARNKGEKK